MQADIHIQNGEEGSTETNVTLESFTTSIQAQISVHFMNLHTDNELVSICVQTSMSCVYMNC